MYHMNEQQEREAFVLDGEDDDDIETVHLYVVPEKKRRRPSLSLSLHQIVHRCMQALAFLLLAGLYIHPQQGPHSLTRIISVAAIPLPIRQVQASAPIVATGVKTIPAIQSQGVLTIYNGSVLTESLPAGFLVNSGSGVEVATTLAVTVPAANLPDLGVTQVSAHAVTAGEAGNISAGAIHQEDGSSLVIKNLSAFRGGQDARTEQVVTADDLTRAEESARVEASAHKPPGIYAHACAETDIQAFTSVTVQLTCQPVTYTVPKGTKVLSVVSVIGNRVVLRVQVLG